MGFSVFSKLMMFTGRHKIMVVLLLTHNPTAKLTLTHWIAQRISWADVVSVFSLSLAVSEL